MNGNNLTDKEFKQRVFNLTKDEYTFLDSYTDNKTKLKVKHNLCGNIYYVSPNKFQQGKRCPICQHRSFKKTTQEFKDEVAKWTNDEYEVLGEYINCKTKILMKHKVCGNEWEITPTHFQQGKRCPICQIKRVTDNQRKTTKEFKQEVYDLVGNDYTVLGEYKKTHEKILIIHNKCGYKYEIEPQKFLSGTRCPKCANKLINTEELKRRMFNSVNTEYTLLSEYISSDTKVKIKHNKCGYIYEVTPNNFINKERRCPKCSICGPSNIEKNLLDYIKSIYKGTILENDRNIIKPKELDIYIPDKKLAIEYDGLYWHSYELKMYNGNLSSKESINYHLDKTLHCQEKGIHLIHIFEDEWDTKQDIVKDHLQNLLGITPNKIYARKCYIDEITNEEKKKFLNSNHIQGNDKSNIKLGLFYPEEDGDRLIACMTFCKPRKSLGQNSNSEYDYELSRYATELDYSVIGGFSKLFKYFERNYEWSRIITYADRRWSKGNLYLKNGFTHIRDSKPNYWYFEKTKVYLGRTHRFAFRKQVLKTKFPNIYSDEKTEKEIMQEAGYLRIYDCGNMVFEYNKERK